MDAGIDPALIAAAVARAGALCAPDLYAIAARLDQPIRVESTCPATATPIWVDISPHGVTYVEPAGTVVAVLDPDGPHFAAGDMSDICAQRRFLASPQAGADPPAPTSRTCTRRV